MRLSQKYLKPPAPPPDNMDPIPATSYDSEREVPEKRKEKYQVTIKAQGSRTKRSMIRFGCIQKLQIYSVTVAALTRPGDMNILFHQPLPVAKFCAAHIDLPALPQPRRNNLLRLRSIDGRIGTKSLIREDVPRGLVGVGQLDRRPSWVFWIENRSSSVPVVNWEAHRIFSTENRIMIVFKFRCSFKFSYLEKHYIGAYSLILFSAFVASGYS